MKRIKSIKFKNHPILKNLALNFYNPDKNTIYNNVIFAGENGSGKTTILNSLYELFKCSELQYTQMPQSNPSTMLNRLEYSLEIEYSLTGEGIVSNDKIAIDYLKGTYSKGNNYSKFYPQFFDKTNTQIMSTSIIKISNLSAIYSGAAIDFDPKPIASVTAKELDNSKKESNKAQKDLATEIKQLLIDMATSDALDSQEYLSPQWPDQDGEVSMPASKLHKRIGRFKEAFNEMFKDNKLIFKGVNKTLKVLFEKNGVEIDIDGLSSGEKQVVFRGGYFLQNKDSLSGSTILIDEPELSMHPKWQTKIFNFYKNLFTGENKIQPSQIFMATHSDHILESALKDENTLIIKLKENEDPKRFSTTENNPISPLTLSQVKYQIFDLPTNDLFIELYSTLVDEGKVSPSKPYVGSDIGYENTPDNYLESITDEKHRNKSKHLISYIRNKIHHPEDKNRLPFTPQELKKTIEFMIKVIKESYSKD